MDTLNVLCVTAEGPVTSFRYPHFAQGVHPTFEMPPPATIYGHICGALGGWLDDPALLRFGYTFTHSGKFEDLEHLHFEGTMNPFRRHLLFEPRLTLYLDYPDLELLYRAFRSPYYAVSLGRSQDLMTYTGVEITTLEQAGAAYFEGTLLSPDFAPFTDGSTLAVTMSRYIDERRQPSWGRYAMLRGRARFPTEASTVGKPPGWVWADPSVREYPGHPDLPRGVWFHALMEESDVIPG